MPNNNPHSTQYSIILFYAEWLDIAIELEIVTDFDLVTKLWKVSVKHLQRLRLANRGHVVLSHYGRTFVQILRTERVRLYTQQKF